MRRSIRRRNLLILIVILLALFPKVRAFASPPSLDSTGESAITFHEPVVAYGERIEKPPRYKKWAAPLLMGILFGTIQLWVYYDKEDNAATGALKVTGPPP